MSQDNSSLPSSSPSHRDERPNPDELLAAIHDEEKKRNEAQLRLFFGMSAGVGKTYAMLKAAHERLKEGDNVMIGNIDTHNRQETQALVQGVPLIPRKKINYRGTVLQEMDLEEILQKKPKVILVDELAHTNVPGSLHPKRWQDVMDILNAGIDVYTTLNVQHIESRKDSIEQITGISIRETVPDSILERANQIELIDISPSELLKRLKEGKVYLGEMAQMAAHNFFREDNLTALREIALRLTAEKVDHELQRMLAIQQGNRPWRTSDRLLVAIDHRPFSEKLIRETRRLAFNLEAPWMAVSIDSGQKLTENESQTLSRNCELARELGAEVATYVDLDIIGGLKKIIQQKKISKLVIGRSSRRWGRDYFFGGSPLYRLIREIQNVDLHVISKDILQERPLFSWPRLRIISPLWHYFMIALAISALTFFLLQFTSVIGHRNIGLMYLITIAFLGLFMPVGPLVFSAFLSSFAWNYFFIPPRGLFYIKHAEDLTLFAAYFITALINGYLTGRIISREQMLMIREERTNTLYEIVRIIASAQNKQECLDAVTEKMGILFNGECAVALKDKNNQLGHYAKGTQWWFNRPKEWGVSQWVFTHQKSAGRGTDTLPLSEALYIPLKGPSEIVGIIAFRPQTQRKFIRDEENLFYAVAQQLAIYLEKEFIQERILIDQQTEEVQKLQQKLIYSISQEIRSPLGSILHNVHLLQQEQHSPQSPTSLEIPLQEMISSSEKLQKAIDNLPEIH